MQGNSRSAVAKNAAIVVAAYPPPLRLFRVSLSFSLFCLGFCIFRTNVNLLHDLGQRRSCRPIFRVNRCSLGSETSLPQCNLNFDKQKLCKGKVDKQLTLEEMREAEGMWLCFNWTCVIFPNNYLEEITWNDQAFTCPSVCVLTSLARASFLSVSIWNVSLRVETQKNVNAKKNAMCHLSSQKSRTFLFYSQESNVYSCHQIIIRITRNISNSQS